MTTSEIGKGAAVAKSHPATMTISVFKVSGECIEIACNPDDTIDVIKSRICCDLGICPSLASRQHLLHEGSELIEGTLANNGIRQGGVLFLVVDAFKRSTKWRVRNAERLTDHWNIGELCMMDEKGGSLPVRNVLCSYNYHGTNLDVVHNGHFYTGGHASSSTWAGNDTPEGQAAGGSWLGFEFDAPHRVVTVRMAQGGDGFPGYQGVHRVWLEAWTDGDWESVGALTFHSADDTSALGNESE